MGPVDRHQVQSVTGGAVSRVALQGDASPRSHVRGQRRRHRSQPGNPEGGLAAVAHKHSPCAAAARAQSSFNAQGGMYSELRRAYKPSKRGKATVLHLSESKDQRFGASLVIQPIKARIACCRAYAATSHGRANTSCGADCV